MRSWEKFSRFIFLKWEMVLELVFGVMYGVMKLSSSLKDSFPELFCIAKDKDASMVDYMQIRNDSVHWAVNFVRI